MKTRGNWFDYDTGTRMIRAIATFHPAYLLRSPSYKRWPGRICARSPGRWQDVATDALKLVTAGRLRASTFATLRCEINADRDKTWIGTSAGMTKPEGLSCHAARAHGASGARWPSRSAAAAGGRSPANRMCAALPARGRGICRAISAGGVPTVSDARQTTTPPVWLNFCGVSHGVALGGGLEQQMRTPGVQRDQAGELGVAGHRAQPLIGAPFKAVAKEMRDRGGGQRRRNLAAAGPGRRLSSPPRLPSSRRRCFCPGSVAARLPRRCPPPRSRIFSATALNGGPISDCAR